MTPLGSRHPARSVLSPLLASFCALCPVLAQDDRAGAVRESARVSIASPLYPPATSTIPINC